MKIYIYITLEYTNLVSHSVVHLSLMGLVFSTSGAKARKSSNRPSWNWFYRPLKPTPKVIKSIILGLVLSTSGIKTESHQIEPPGSDFVNSWHRRGRRRNCAPQLSANTNHRGGIWPPQIMLDWSPSATVCEFFKVLLSVITQAMPIIDMPMQRN